MMNLSSGLCVDQDEKGLYTFHFVVPEDTDLHTFDAKKAIRGFVGGLAGECDVAMDEIIVTGMWKSRLGVANRFRSAGGRALLAGDAGKYHKCPGHRMLNLVQLISSRPSVGMD